MRERASSVVESEVGEDLLLFNSEKQTFFALNVAAKIVWKNYFGDKDIVSAVDALTVAFGLSPKDDVKGDVADILNQLEKAELIKPASRGRADPAEQKVQATTVLLRGRDYMKPSMQEIPMEWLKKMHPGAIVDVMFSDTWGPATDTIQV